LSEDRNEDGLSLFFPSWRNLARIIIHLPFKAGWKTQEVGEGVKVAIRREQSIYILKFYLHSEMLEI
jgi:hypothetical protein